MLASKWLTVAKAVTLLATALALMTELALAQTLQDLKCAGKPDIPWTDQIAGCGNAITSRSFSGKDLAAAFISRGTAYAATGDLDRALADYSQAIAVDA